MVTRDVGAASDRATTLSGDRETMSNGDEECVRDELGPLE